MKIQETTILSADSIRNLQYRRQIEFIYEKILDAVKNFRNQCYINCDFKINEEAIRYLKEMGYKVLINYQPNRSPYIYIYEIDWR